MSLLPILGVIVLIKERLLIGQYYPVDSPIHRLNAKAKLLVTLIYMIAILSSIIGLVGAR